MTSATALRLNLRLSASACAQAKGSISYPRPVHSSRTLELPKPKLIRSQLPPKVAELVKQYPSLLNQPVQWGELDSFGHLNNVTTARYFESGRMAYFEQILKPYLEPKLYKEFVSGIGIGPIIKSVSIKYRLPGYYPDLVTIALRVRPEDVLKDRVTQTFVIVSHAQEAVIAEGNSVVVMYDYRKGCKTDIPSEILAAHKKGEAANLD
eukprot:jgi/Hompol1/1717/HPOL_000256-RA